MVDYTQETVRDVLLAGIADLDIRREALSTQDIQEQSINDVIAFDEGREMARNATPASYVSSLSTFKRHQRPAPQIQRTDKSMAPKAATQVPDKNKSAPCPDCGKAFQPFKQRNNGSWNKNPHKKCLNCWRQSRHKSTEVNAALATDDQECDYPEYIFQVSAVEHGPAAPAPEDQTTNVRTIPLSKKNI